ncbi:MAG: transcription termination factor NusA [bacterium]|nr:transcription termination factor NusA [bacterium]
MENFITKEFEAAINQICDEKGISREVVFETVESALAAAYRKDYGKPDENPRAKYNKKTGNFDLFDVKEVVADDAEIKDTRKQIPLAEAKKKKKKIKVGEEIVTPLQTPGDYGRVAAQTAKQVIIQRIREAERDALFNAFKNRRGELANGVVQRIEGNTVFVDIGQATGFLPPSEQARNEHYQANQRLKVYIMEVREGAKGPEIILSRTHPEIIKILFGLEVPEVNSGSVEIRVVAREAGFRTKIAVASRDPEVDPIGACVGQRGSRVQAVINEINGEKIDIIEWNKDPSRFIPNALGPAKVLKVKLNAKEKVATVFVAPDQLSLAIGKEGQNVRLAARLTEWKIDVKAMEKVEEKKEMPVKPVKSEKVEQEKKPEDAKEIAPKAAQEEKKKAKKKKKV